jgi:hypothetical protein
MPTFPIKLATVIGDRYLMWSTIVDAPVTYGMEREEFLAWYKDEYGARGEVDPIIMYSVDKHGLPPLALTYWKTIRNLVAYNRAGDDEATISLGEIIRRYCIEIPNKE